MGPATGCGSRLDAAAQLSEDTLVRVGAHAPTQRRGGDYFTVTFAVKVHVGVLSLPTKLA